MHLKALSSLAAENRSRRQVPEHHRALPAGHGRPDAGSAAATLRCSSNCTEVSLYSMHWPCLFPQHGPGRKHLRPTRLEPWQEELVKEAAEDFVRGLIASDGCRVVANDRGVRSVRYHFSNRSDDIRALYCAALDHLKIPWTQPRWFDIAVYRKAAVARLDEFVGPKL
jgi:hypothetical protein